MRRNLGDVYATAVLEAMDREMISVADATYYLVAKVPMLEKLERELAGSRIGSANWGGSYELKSSFLKRSPGLRPDDHPVS
jgi:hypothetical protein